MTPAEFQDRWTAEGGELVLFAPSALADVRMPAEGRAFLLNVGLPRSAAPYLDFRSPSGSPLPTASEMWQLPDGFSHYRVIGSNGSGDPICIDEDEDGAIVYLNHDNEFARVFINSSVPQLAECLLAFRGLIRESQSRNGPDAYLDGNLPNDLLDGFVETLKAVDGVTLYDDSMWEAEVTDAYNRRAL
jgi:hypothetical protein